MITRISRRNSCAVIQPTVRPTQLPAPRRLRSDRGAWHGSLADGGWSFALDPDLSADAAPALWRPHVCAHVTIARPAPKGFAALRLGEMIEGSRVATEFLAQGEWHVVLHAGGRRHRFVLRRCVSNERLAFLTPADAHAEYRAAMIMALHRALLGLARARPPVGGSPGPTEHWRLVQWLRLLDAASEGASPREIAAVLLIDDAASYSAAEWDASSERRRITRWQRAALAMRDGGYRALLTATL